MKHQSTVVNAPIIGLDEEKYRGKWLVIAQETGEIVIVGDSLEEASKKATDRSMKHFGFYRVPTTNTHYISVK
ncbi:MAG: hypothetical protein A3C02_00675 [Candidatus Andersenbacteria bacterium RIFCSPHIGHO2_02_FULL_45_11]|uniref:DUF5678 domain-containing protein n=1 Tax=Candidatus Andersenbacteria bacterium RIFCSPHIGHO2_12_FULL_45_11 TaxID=1797281 RepID=A0A1G1X231_9BACT|nr:MAG: hypothetical protein A2805_02400 [Candidatus Andersenbacteria bacterium RIFCSPHIGHO2_01_FULL_46_36]OGY32901.1 MAG: hypothetical protein A3C02_00675 [Candidatus Andersenbacteria bacterium RIFCSPHIGHO2_02_FULL_45_11]OGY34059.1 MAG: hypothetical protein A3D99_02270 [Candidatus Andersenbacteria bacterium RIFCSPHIGHO2_12_FULL_45_11]